VHRDGRIHGLADGDIRVLEKKDDNASGLGFGQRESPGSELRPTPPGQIEAGFRTPILGVIAVEVKASDSVLIVFPVGIVIDPFAVDLEISFSLPDSFHQTAGFVFGIKNVFSLAFTNLFSHLKAEAIPVQILSRVLIQEAVSIAVVGPDRAPVGLGRVQIEL
jgi:hypothetical protein